MKKLMPTILGLVLMMGFGTGGTLAQEVKMGVAKEPYAFIIGHIIKTTLEATVGAKVTLTPASTPVIWKSLDTGDLNINPSMWLPNSQTYYDTYVVKNGTVVCTDAGWRVQPGFYVTKEGYEKYGIRKIYDLLKPEVVALTDTKNTGKGEIWAGDPTWNSTNIDKLRAKGYGFAELYDMQAFAEEVEAANVLAGLKANKVLVFAGDDMIAAHFPPGSVFRLEEPPHDPSKWNPKLPAQDPNWYQNGNIATSYKTVVANICYNKGLRETAPQVTSVLEAIKFDTAEILEMVYENVVNKKDTETVAKEWVAKNGTRVKDWLKP
jgi:glycine betaine/proline transport system substrate-binding protein